MWLDTKPYDQVTGEGSIGVEFAGTAVSSSGTSGTLASVNKKSKGLVTDNKELQWAEGYYRGYYELHISPQAIQAQYYGKYPSSSPACFKNITILILYVGCPTVATRNPFEISLANFTVKAGSNHLERNVANGTVEAGALQRGNVKQTNLTLNTDTGTWNVTKFEKMYIEY